ncbi:MAG: hypothetical protein WD844_04050 [Thermoleophilaceae bacterium]
MPASDHLWLRDARSRRDFFRLAGVTTVGGSAVFLAAGGDDDEDDAAGSGTTDTGGGEGDVAILKPSPDAFVTGAS